MIPQRFAACPIDRSVGEGLSGRNKNAYRNAGSNLGIQRIGRDDGIEPALNESIARGRRNDLCSVHLAPRHADGIEFRRKKLGVPGYRHKSDTPAPQTLQRVNVRVRTHQQAAVFVAELDAVGMSWCEVNAAEIIPAT